MSKPCALAVQPFLYAGAGPWIVIRDGNRTAMNIFGRHYTARPHRKIEQFIGPGKKLALITQDAKAIFAWRKEEFRLDAQFGVNCPVFRNEGTAAGKSSYLIRAACDLAWEEWPGERLFTFVDPAKIRMKAEPGRCFLRAGFQYCGVTPKGLLILERLQEETP